MTNTIHIHLSLPADGRVGTLEAAIARIAQVENCRIHREFDAGVLHYRLEPRERQEAPAQSAKVVELESRRREFWPSHPHSPSAA